MATETVKINADSSGLTKEIDKSKKAMADLYKQMKEAANLSRTEVLTNIGTSAYPVLKAGIYEALKGTKKLDDVWHNIEDKVKDVTKNMASQWLAGRIGTAISDIGKSNKSTLSTSNSNVETAKDSPKTDPGKNTKNTSSKEAYEKWQKDYKDWQEKLNNAYNAGNLEEYKALLNNRVSLTYQSLKDQQAAIDLYQNLWNEANISAIDATNNICNSAYPKLKSGLEEYLKGTKSISEVWHSVEDAVKESIKNMVAQWLSATITMGAFNLLKNIFGFSTPNLELGESKGQAQSDVTANNNVAAPLTGGLTPGQGNQATSAKAANGFDLQKINGQLKAMLSTTNAISAGTMRIGSAWNIVGNCIAVVLGSVLANWIAQQAGLTGLANSSSSSATAASVAQAAEIGAAWAPAAAAVSLATFGANAAPAILGMTLAYGLSYLFNKVGGKAAGGLVSGPGTSTSDSMLTRLSNGEYVIRASAVDKFGVGLFNTLNSGNVPRFATGAPLTAAGRYSGTTMVNHKAFEKTAQIGNEMHQNPVNVTFNVSALDTRGFGRWLETGGGAKIQKYFDKQASAFALAGVKI